MPFSFNRRLAVLFDTAIANITDALKKEGFSILTEIDLKEKFKEKLGVDFRKYKILGACNPSFAYKAVQQEDRIGVLLPCNVLVQEYAQGDIEIAVINPSYSIGSLDNDILIDLAEEVSEKLKRALESA